LYTGRPRWKEIPGGPWQFIGLLPLFDQPTHNSAETIHMSVNLDECQNDYRYITYMKKTLSFSYLYITYQKEPKMTFFFCFVQNYSWKLLH